MYMIFQLTMYMIYQLTSFNHSSLPFKSFCLTQQNLSRGQKIKCIKHFPKPTFQKLLKYSHLLHSNRIKKITRTAHHC